MSLFTFQGFPPVHRQFGGRFDAGYSGQLIGLRKLATLSVYTQIKNTSAALPRPTVLSLSLFSPLHD